MSTWQTVNGRSLAFEFRPEGEGWVCDAMLLDGRKAHGRGQSVEEALAHAREQVAEMLIGGEARRLDGLLRRLAEK